MPICWNKPKYHIWPNGILLLFTFIKDLYLAISSLFCELFGDFSCWYCWLAASHIRSQKIQKYHIPRYQTIVLQAGIISKFSSASTVNHASCLEDLNSTWILFKGFYYKTQEPEIEMENKTKTKTKLIFNIYIHYVKLSYFLYCSTLVDKKTLCTYYPLQQVHGNLM